MFSSLSQTAIDGIALIGFFILIMYYADVIGSLKERNPRKKLTKKQFLFSTVPFVLWAILLFEEYSNLE